jgi:hypothetical protein
MALSVKPFALAALALAAILVPAIRQERSSVMDPMEARVRRLDSLRWRINAAVHLSAAMMERDSSGSLGATHARVGTPPILLRGFETGARSPIAEQEASSVWSSLATFHPAVRSAVVIYDGQRYNAPWMRSGRYYTGARITRTEDGITCVVMVPGWSVRNGTISVGKSSLNAAMAPCILASAFGPPGPAVAPWLEATRWHGASSSAWLTRGREFIDGRGAPPWTSDHVWFGRQSVPRSRLLSSPITRSVAEMLAPPYEQGVSGLRCLAGMVDACRANALDTMWVADGTRSYPRDLVFDIGLSTGTADLAAPRPPVDFWISDLIRDQGRESFVRFWRADGSFEQAFETAFGETLGAWTMRWALRQWENSWEEKYRRQPRLLGVTLRPSWPLLVLGWTGVALLGAAWTARKRKVT